MSMSLAISTGTSQCKMLRSLQKIVWWTYAVICCSILRQLLRRDNYNKNNKKTRLSETLRRQFSAHLTTAGATSSSFRSKIVSSASGLPWPKHHSSSMSPATPTEVSAACSSTSGFVQDSDCFLQRNLSRCLQPGGQSGSRIFNTPYTWSTGSIPFDSSASKGSSLNALWSKDDDDSDQPGRPIVNGIVASSLPQKDLKLHVMPSLNVGAEVNDNQSKNTIESTLEKNHEKVKIFVTFSHTLPITVTPSNWDA